MKIITRKTQAAEAADRWIAQYQRDRDGIAAKIKSLGGTPDPDAVDRIIGNDSWTSVDRCSECDKDSEVIVRLGQEPNYESSTAWICPACLRQALALVKGLAR
jgi:hypothetical protein